MNDKIREEKLREVAERMADLREIMDISAEEMAEAVGMTAQEYCEYERGEHDFTFSFLATVADKLKVDVIDIMMGESPRLSVCSVVRKGEGFNMERRKEYKYEHLAFVFKNKKMEPFMVTVETSDVNAKTHMNTHSGQEFNYIVQGSLTLYIANQAILLNEGDAVYYDAMHPHSMQAEGGTCRFLSIIAK